VGTVQQSTFIITREDRAEDPKTIIREGLRIGRLPDSDLWLNHPSVSRLHAGINEVKGYFYIINLSGSSATTFNGRVIPFNDWEALTVGDEIQIGPYFLHIEKMPESGMLSIRVAQQFALFIGERPGSSDRASGPLRATGPLRASGPLRATGPLRGVSNLQGTGSGSGDLSEVADALKVFWAKRTREKAGRPSPLHPRTPPRPGKARFNWTPTRDLVRPWPFAILLWALIVVGTFSAVAAVKYRIAFAPGPISAAHEQETFTLIPAIAKQPNASSCTSCHALGVSVTNREKMNANCATCHQTEAFVATNTRAHREAGIGCTSCHAEHRGEGFRPVNAALENCAKCHSDQNKRLYKGKMVHTPHGGTYGYPVVNGVWIWKGFDEEQLAEKTEIVAFLKQNRVTSSQQQAWRNAQFHAIHVERVRVAAGIEGIEDVDGGGEVLSCSSCHKSGYMGVNIDRTYPRKTCAQCHNSQVFHQISDFAVEMSCASCHVEHIKDSRRASPLLITQTKMPASEIKE
jgi:hypothetical protein